MIRNTLEEDKALKLLQKEFGNITASYVGENKMKKLVMQIQETFTKNTLRYEAQEKYYRPTTSYDKLHERKIVQDWRQDLYNDSEVFEDLDFDLLYNADDIESSSLGSDETDEI